ncbi:MAG: endonuclease III [Coprobacillus sp.]|nr:endonuclease III [Coprobacillus sp.]
MNKKSIDIEYILSYFRELFPDAHCELNYTKDYELAIAVLLSAQTTDKKVNEVTAVLFNKYKTLQDLANADVRDIEEIIKILGIYKNKAKNVIDFAKKLLSDFDGILPSEKEKLTTLPGIGNKSAGVIRAEVFKIPDLAVDTHVKRVSARLGLAKYDDSPDEVEKKLKKIIDESDWINAHHLFIHFGRYFCLARNPHCEECKLKDICKYYSAK